MSSLARKMAGGRRGPEKEPKVEKLVAVAIIRNGEVIRRGFRSHYELRASLGDPNPQTRNLNDTEGFITSMGRFVDRAEAQDIGHRAGQCSRMGRELLSSDIDW